MVNHCDKETQELHKQLIDIVGEEKICQLYELFGGTRISFAPSYEMVKEQKILKSLKESPDNIKETAKKLKIGRTTVYRIFKRNINALSKKVG